MKYHDLVETSGISASGIPSAQRLGVLIALLVLVVAVYIPVAGYPFTGFDDDIVILGNPTVRAGLSLDGLRWAFTNPASLWHPLVWISHMADVSFFGLRPGGHHLTNVLLHAANTVLLYLVLGAMTGSGGRSAFVAALFAVHPLHVESVAWITERKDVLSGLFWMLGLGAHIRYARRPGTGRYLALLVAFALGLMAKPMLVTFPFVLLLLDVWPLGRFRLPVDGAPSARRRRLSALVAEKIPLLALAAAASFVALRAAGRGGILSAVETVPVGARLANAVVSYAWYVLKAVIPTSLAVYYPHPGTAVGPLVPVAAAFLAAVTWFLLRSPMRWPALVVGWLWYLGTLVPVSGIVQVGAFARADRYAYLPLTGLFLLAAWGLPQLLSERRFSRPLLPVAAAATVVLTAIAGSVQVGYWRDDETLFGRALAVTRGNWMVHGNLGVTLMEKGDLDRATLHLREAVRLNPGYELARLNLGQALSLLGRDEEAEAEFLEVLRQRPEDQKAYFCLGQHYAERGRWDEAVHSLGEAVRLNPAFAAAQESLGWALLHSGRGAAAVAPFRAALAADPGSVEALNGLGAALAEAEAHRRESERLGAAGR